MGLKRGVRYEDTEKAEQHRAVAQEDLEVRIVDDDAIEAGYSGATDDTYERQKMDCRDDEKGSGNEEAHGLWLANDDARGVPGKVTCRDDLRGKRCRLCGLTFELSCLRRLAL